MICRYVGFFNSFLRCVPAGVRPFPLAMQHFNSFVFKVISLLLSPRFSACIAGVRPFPLAMQHFYSFVSHVVCLLLFSRFGACTAGIRPFFPFQHCYSPVSQVIWSVLSPFCFLLCPFLLVIVSALSPFLSPLLSPFLLVIVSALSSFFRLHVPPLSPSRLQPFTLSPSCSALQSFTFVTQLWALGCMSLACNPLHVSPCVYICLPALDCCGRLCLAILCLPALDVASSSRRVFRF